MKHQINIKINSCSKVVSSYLEEHKYQVSKGVERVNERLTYKEHYYYKIHSLLMKSSAHPLSFYRQAPYMDYHLPPFLQENIDPPSRPPPKSQPPL